MKKMMTFLGILCLLASLLCIGGGMIYMHQYAAETKEYEMLEQSLVLPDLEKKDRLEINWAELKRINPEIIGWLYIPDLLSYPVVQAKDNQMYLHQSFEGKKTFSGTIFMNASNRKDLSDSNTILYGHNMRNGSMFGSLKKYESATFAKKHAKIYFYTEQGCYEYLVLGYLTTKDASKVYQITTPMEEYLSFVQSQWNEVITDMYGIQSILSLSTCRGRSGGTKRGVVQAAFQRFVPDSGTIPMGKLAN